jgi:hypothetical protein
MNTIAFCITGWHFPEHLYQAFSDLSNVDLFIISHKGRRRIPDFIFNLFPESNILIRRNIGYDWGCYQQFLASGLWRNYDILFFMHDDIIIHDLGFIDESIKLLSNHAVVGNGVGVGSVSFTGVKEHPYAYVHSDWKPVNFDFHHNTVRGSYFATTREVLERVSSFEVYWDPFKINIEFGNWSTKATCGKLEGIFGRTCFGYLSGTFGKSQYITEHFRGHDQVISEQSAGLRDIIYRLLKRISSEYLEIYYAERNVRYRSFWLGVMKTLLRLFSSKLY